MNIFIIGYRILNYGFLKNFLWSIAMAVVILFQLFSTRTFGLDLWLSISMLSILVIAEIVQIVLNIKNKPILEVFVSHNKDFDLLPANVSWEMSIFWTTITIAALSVNIFLRGDAEIFAASSIMAWIGIWLSILSRSYFHDYIKNAQMYLHMLMKDAFKHIEEIKNAETSDDSSH